MRRESERKDAIIMQMAQANAALAARVPELEAPEPQRSPETAANLHPSVDPQGDGAGQEVVNSSRSWWHRLFK
jgi:hypothetical protein